MFLFVVITAVPLQKLIYKNFFNFDFASIFYDFKICVFILPPKTLSLVIAKLLGFNKLGVKLGVMCFAVMVYLCLSILCQ